MRNGVAIKSILTHGDVVAWQNFRKRAPTASKIKRRNSINIFFEIFERNWLT